MPLGDGTGPNGMGPMTGRAAGFCAGYNAPGYANPAVRGRGLARGYGRGMGYGFGRGRAWGRPWGGFSPPPMTPGYQPGPYAASYRKEDEVDMLKNQAQFFEDQLNQIKERLGELESEED